MINSNCQAGKAIPFITCDKSESFRVTSEAIDFLSALPCKRIGVVSLVGKYRTGKSFLLNRILLQQKPESGFAVGPTINSCTKGIWLWSVPLKSENPGEEDLSLLVMDTEGFGGVNEHRNHDMRIFIFSILLSSMFIYNSVGSIDENALQGLGLVLNLAREVQKADFSSKEKTIQGLSKIDQNLTDRSFTQNSAYFIEESRTFPASKNPSFCTNFGNANNNELDEETIADNFPAFLWLIRDFALELLDPFGNPISPKKYLELALESVKGNTDASESKNKLRKLVKHFFRSRDCLTLIRPVEKEADLQRLDSLGDSALRPEFLLQAKKARRLVLAKTPVKRINKVEMDGLRLLYYAQSIVQSVNSGRAPSIDYAWNYISASQNERTLWALFDKVKASGQEIKSVDDVERILKGLAEKYESDKMGDEFSATQLKEKILDDFRKELEQKLNRFKAGEKQALRACIDSAIQELTDFVLGNENFTMQQIEDLSERKLSGLRNKLSQKSKDSSLEKYLSKVFAEKKTNLLSLAIGRAEARRVKQEEALSARLEQEQARLRETQQALASRLGEFEAKARTDQATIAELERQSTRYLAIIESAKEDKERVSSKLKQREEEIERIEFEISDTKQREISSLKQRIFSLESELALSRNQTSKEALIHSNNLAFLEKEKEALSGRLQANEAELAAVKKLAADQKEIIGRLSEELKGKQAIDPEVELVVPKAKYRALKEQKQSFEELRVNYEKIIHELNEEKNIIQSQFEILKDNYEYQKTKNIILLNEIKSKIENLELCGSPVIAFEQIENELSVINNPSGVNSHTNYRLAAKTSNQFEAIKEQQEKKMQENLNSALNEQDKSKLSAGKARLPDKSLSQNMFVVSVTMPEFSEKKNRSQTSSREQKRRPFEYKLELLEGERSLTLSKRFRDFCQLAMQLQSEFPALNFPASFREITDFLADIYAVPGTQALPAEDRRRLLEKLIIDIYTNPELSHSRSFANFLKSTNDD